MKRFILFIGILSLLSSCDKDSLNLTNPNQPTFEAIKTEAGMTRLGLGVYTPMRDNYYWWVPWGLHQAMGDVVTISAGNFSWRWANQTSEIIDPDGTSFKPSSGGSQAEQLRAFNSRLKGDDNAMKWEWVSMYLVNGMANTILSQVDGAAYTGNAEVKKKALKIWAYWWKGYAYSKIGAMYSKGIIVDKVGETNGNYVANTIILNEAKKNFVLAKGLLAGIAENDADFASIMSYVVPNYLQQGKGGVFTPKMIERNINSFLARNLLIQKAASDLTDVDLDQIKTLAETGITETDFVFTVRSALASDLVFETAWSPYRVLVGWENVSERLVQDFRVGDNRKTRNVKTLGTPVVNPRGRGYQYGTRYTFVDGGDYVSSTAGQAEAIMSCSYEENQLMLAEVYIRKNEVEKGLGYIDAVRNYQKAQLPALVGADLTKDQALEELRSERRIGLIQKGPVCFYDARRWGVTKPLSQGGGRKNANVVFAGGVAKPCTINYNYMDYFDVPANETDFNPMPTTQK